MPRLTGPFVSKAKPDPGGKDLSFFDGRIPGFALRVKASGVKFYYLQYRDPFGRQRRVGIGAALTPERRDGLTPTQALKRARKARAAIDGGQDPAAEIAGARTAKTVSQICDEYLRANVNRIKSSTLAVDKSRIETHVKPLLGSRAVASLKPTDMEKFLTDVAAGKSVRLDGEGRTKRGGIARGGKGVASRTLGMLGTILQRAVRDGILANNPVRGIARPKDQPKKPPFSFAAVRAVGMAMKELEAEGEGAIGLRAIRFLLLSGFRRMEGLTLQWGAVDIEGHCARLADTKSGKQTRPLGIAALDHLMMFKPNDAAPKDYVFPGEGKSKHYVGVPKAWARVTKRAELADISLHGLRHWYASAAAEMNYSELVIAGLLGHSARGVTGRYATTPDSALVAAADAVSRRLAEALGN
jgi:integrase